MSRVVQADRKATVIQITALYNLSERHLRMHMSNTLTLVGCNTASLNLMFTETGQSKIGKSPTIL